MAAARLSRFFENPSLSRVNRLSSVRVAKFARKTCHVPIARSSLSLIPWTPRLLVVTISQGG